MRVSNCTVEEFFGHLKATGKKIVCYGAGSAISANFYNFKSYHIEDITLFLCDGSQDKWGTDIALLGEKFQVRSSKDMLTLDPREFVILITCWNTVSVIAELEKYSELEQVECFSANTMQVTPTFNLARQWKEVASTPAFYDYQNILRNLNLKDKHKGERCFIIGNGPSLKPDDLDKIKGEASFAVNNIGNVFGSTTWRPTYFMSVDTVAYHWYGKEYSEMQAGYRFLNVKLADLYCTVYDKVLYFNVWGVQTENDFSEDITKGIYLGFGILYTVLQLAVYMGFSKIYLLGVDHRLRKEKTLEGEIIENTDIQDHFYDEPEIDTFYEEAEKMCRLFYGDQNQNEARSDDLTENFKTAKRVCEHKGIEIFNATRGGYLEVFPRVDFDSLF